MAEQKEKIWYEHLKGVLEVVRDIAVLTIFVMLLVSPGFVKQRLTDAGFKSGNLAGFVWEAEAALENAMEETKEATANVAALERQLQDARVELTQLRAVPALSAEAREHVSRLATKMEKTMAETSTARDRLQKSLGAQQTLIKQLRVKR
jgi:chromosome segregation ATPase